VNEKCQHFLNTEKHRLEKYIWYKKLGKGHPFEEVE